MLAMFILIVLSFTLATTHWAAWMAAVTVQIRLPLVTSVGMDLSERMALADAGTATPVLIQIYVSPCMVL
jgi:hypothetical protein